jgi:protein ImuB
MTTARYACLDAREFPLQALLRLRPQLQSKAVAVLDGEPPFEQVCSLNDPALTLGIAPGMTKLEMEIFPSALVLARSRAEEAAAHAALLECAGTFSPRVEDQSSDGYFSCVIDIAGTETLFGSPDALGERLLKRTQALGIHPSIAISSNFHAARCLARGLSLRAGIRVAPRGMECAALAPLPLDVLDLSPEHAETFSMWGITTLGELAKLEETELIARLGQPGKELRLLAQGESPHLFTAIEST